MSRTPCPQEGCAGYREDELVPVAGGNIPLVVCPRMSKDHITLININHGLDYGCPLLRKDP